MIEPEPEKPQRSNLQVFIGFLLGCVAALMCMFLTIFLALTLSEQRAWLFPTLNAAGLIVAGLIGFRHARRSSYAAGMVIAFSLAFLLNGACAVAFWR